MSAPPSIPGFIHRFIPAERPDEPTLLLLHGTGGDESDLLAIGAALRPGAALLSPRGKVLENDMPRFFRRLAMGVFDLDDLRARTHELADWLASAAATYYLDPKRIVAVGYSNGANIAASMLLLRPEVLSAAALFRAMVPFVPETLPDLRGRRLFLAAGQTDSMVPPDNAERLAELLRNAGADVELRWTPSGHGLVRDELDAAGNWLARVTTKPTKE
jgi:phospholipase/carboxylesterase/glyoxalase family protein